MKRVYIFIIILILSLSVQSVFAAGNPRVVVVRITGCTSTPPVLGINFTWRAWLGNDEGRAITNGAEIFFRVMPGGAPGEYQLAFNLTKFPAWNSASMLHIEVVYEGKTSAAWAEVVGPDGSVSKNYYLDESKYIVIPDGNTVKEEIVRKNFVNKDLKKL